MSMPRIEWNDLMRGYNYRYGTEYTSINEWIADIHRARPGISNAKLLGISQVAFYDKIASLGLTPFKKGPRKKTLQLYVDFLYLAEQEDKLSEQATKDERLRDSAFHMGRASALKDCANRLRGTSHTSKRGELIDEQEGGGIV